MTRLFALALLVMAQIACALQPVTVSAPKQEYGRSMFTDAFARHNLEPERVLHIDGDAPRMRIEK